MGGITVITSTVSRDRRSCSASPGDAVEAIRSLEHVLVRTEIGRCSSVELQAMAAAARDGQAAIESLLTRVGVAADRLAASGVPGARDAHETLLGRGQVRSSTARRERARSMVAAKLDKLGHAVEQGRVGGDHLDSFARATKGLSDEERQLLNTDEMIEAAASLPADTFNRRVQGEADRIRGDHGLRETRAKQAASSWRQWFDESTGMGRVSASFDPERYEAIANVVEQGLARLANQGDVTKNDNLAATAAYELLTRADDRRSGSAHISIIVDHQTMVVGVHDKSVCETADGHRLPPESISRLACNAVIQRVVHDRRRLPIDVGRKHRTATDAQWRAIRSIYMSCAWFGCERPLSWCQLHHIREWEQGGPTDLCNLIPLCNHHHHAVHEGGWAVKLRPDRTLRIIRPDGTLAATTSPDRLPARPQAP